MQLIDGKKYYTVAEAAQLAKVSVRTLRRWLASGRLSEFLFPFRVGPNEVLYRLEEPEEGDVKNPDGEWVASKGARHVKGGGQHESSS